MSKTVLFTMSQVALAPVIGDRFVGMLTGAPCAAGAKAQGVARYNAAVGEAFAVNVLGTSTVDSGAAVAPGVAVKSDAVGRAIPQAGVGEILGYAVGGASAADQKIEILLTL